jgi:multicomponent Na+:H+ antiporter subunit E
MLSFLLTTVIMFAFWFLMSGQLHPIFLILGVVFSLLVAMWSHDLLIGRVNKMPDLGRGLRIIAYLPWLLWQITLANLYVIYLVLHPKMPIEPQIVRFKNTLKTDLGIVILANSITLTPGTTTIEGNHDEFIVHSIAKKTADDLLSGEMQARVRGIEGTEKEMERLYV